MFFAAIYKEIGIVAFMLHRYIVQSVYGDLRYTSIGAVLTQLYSLHISSIIPQPYSTSVITLLGEYMKS